MQLDSLHIATGNAGPNLSQSYGSLLQQAKEKFRLEIDSKDVNAVGTVSSERIQKNQSSIKPVNSSESTPKNYMFNSHIRTTELVFSEPLGNSNEVSTIVLPETSEFQTASLKQSGYFITLSNTNSGNNETSESEMKLLKEGRKIRERYNSGKKHQKGKLVNVVG